jgi:hypothetical protein
VIDVQVEGQIKRSRVGRGSKSDRVTIVLATAEGDLILREKGSDSYTGQAALVPLIGKRIRAFGVVSNRQLFMDRYEVLD